MAERSTPPRGPEHKRIRGTPTGLTPKQRAKRRPGLCPRSPKRQLIHSKEVNNSCGAKWSVEDKFALVKFLYMSHRKKW